MECRVGSATWLPSSRSALARGCGFTVGPGCLACAGGGGWRGALVVADDGEAAPAGLEGYLRAAVPAALADFDADAPIMIV